MTVTAKRLIAPVQLAATSALLFTATAKQTIIKAASLCNSTAANHSATLYLVPYAGTAGVTNIIEDALGVAPHTTVTACDLVGHTMLVGDMIYGLADAATAVTLHLSGMEIQ
jgi:hypothetical protein